MTQVSHDDYVATLIMNGYIHVFRSTSPGDGAHGNPGGTETAKA